jgi:hypothetical protein
LDSERLKFWPSAQFFNAGQDSGANWTGTFLRSLTSTVVVKELEIPRAFHPVSPAPVVKRNESPSFSTPLPMNRDNFTVLFIMACPLATQHRVVLAKHGRRLVQERRQNERRKAAGQRQSGRDASLTIRFVMRTTNSIGTTQTFY